MNINKNFVGSRMNKGLDERLVPKGEYTDALNIRISSDEDGESGSVENTKGNELVFSPEYNGTEVEGTCIGAFEDGENETIYWFITSSTVDMIVSYNTSTESAIYHVVSTSVLNFSSNHLINGINLIDDFLFFTDNYNQPRRINVNSSYPNPISGVDQITEDDISVIVKPPMEAPKVVLSKKASKQNYIENKFIRFAYRYKYKDGEYSALSEFSDLAFTPGQFRLDYGSYDMIGMRNSMNSAAVKFNTGGANVVGVDLCFITTTANIANVVEKYNKVDSGWADNTEVTVIFENQKIYTTLTESELLRVYDNVPKLAKAQTTIGNRIMYGNYVDGYDIDTILDYSLELKSEDISFNQLTEDKSNGIDYSISGSNVTVTDSKLDIDLTDMDLVEGGIIEIDFNIIHSSFGGSATYEDGGEIENSYEEVFQFVLPKDYDSVEDLALDQDFLDSIQITDASGFPGTLADGYSLTDLFYASIQTNTSGDWDLANGGVTSSNKSFLVSHSGDTLSIQVPAVVYEDSTSPGTFAYEYFLMSSTTASYTEVGNKQSLHSNRDYELGIVYLDEYNRASTALVCNNNTIYVPPQESVNKNTITATIDHIAPSWAKRYRFVLKQSKGAYDTIYSDQYYYDAQESAWWVKLEGDNQTKCKVGDSLIVKKSSNGPTSDEIKTKVLDLTTKEKFFIDETNEVPPTSGVYMKLKPSLYSINNAELDDIDFGSQGGKNNSFVTYQTFVDDGSGNYSNYTITSGSEVRIYFRNVRFGSGTACGSRQFIFDRTFIATRDYDNMYDFIIGENINFNNPTNNPEIESSDDTTPTASFDNTVGDYNANFSSSEIQDGVTQIQWVESGTEDTSDYRSGLRFITAGRKCNGRNYYLDVHLQVFRSGGVLIFETEPADNTNEIYYESSESFPINNRLHSGNVTNQTSSVGAVVDLDFYNCFAFGNGAESFKVNDGLAEPGFSLGARVTAVSEQDYKEAHRYADITYSGVYNQETNLYKLNEFNLGLVNYKGLEQNYGPIEVMHARESNILVLQEDKISYVIANGKNLFSDAQAGGAIINTPDVLGKQVPRPEEYGISNNPESFATYGYDVYFTDTKRGSVINLKGTSGQNDQINVISSLGMSSWFRDQFLDNHNKIQLGGYDPYSKEYVLSSTNRAFDVPVKQIGCGFTLSQQSSSSVVTRNVKLSEYNGSVEIDYDVTSGSINVSVTYNNVEVIDQTVTGSGTLSFSSDEYGVHECDLVVTPTNATYTLEFGCVQAQEVTVVRIVNNTELMSGKSIHHDLYWRDGFDSSPIYTDFVEFTDGPVSLYETYTASESFGMVPPEGGEVTMRIREELTDTASFSSDKFKYLVSNTLYDESDIATLLPLLQEATTITNPTEGSYEAKFTYNNTSNHSYLYLVWEYIDVESDPLNIVASFNANGGNETYADQTGASPLSVTSPGTPTRSGYTFDAWSPSLPTTITSNTTFFAQWTTVSDRCIAVWISDDDSEPETGSQDLVTGAGLYYTLNGIVTYTPFNNLFPTIFTFEGTQGKLFFVCSSVAPQYYLTPNGAPDSLPEEFLILTGQPDGNGGTLGGGSCTTNGDCSI